MDMLEYHEMKWVISWPSPKLGCQCTARCRRRERGRGRVKGAWKLLRWKNIYIETAEGKTKKKTLLLMQDASIKLMNNDRLRLWRELKERYGDVIN